MPCKLDFTEYARAFKQKPKGAVTLRLSHAYTNTRTTKRPAYMCKRSKNMTSICRSSCCSACCSVCCSMCCSVCCSVSCGMRKTNMHTCRDDIGVHHHIFTRNIHGDTSQQHTHTHIQHTYTHSYGVATISRLFRIVGLVCKKTL